MMIYRKAREIILERIQTASTRDWHYVYGLCNIIGTAAKKLNLFNGYDADMSNYSLNKSALMKRYPELAKYKPKTMFEGNDSFWWSPSVRGLKKRLSIIDKILEDEKDPACN